MKPTPTPNQPVHSRAKEQAEALAISALGFIAGDEERLERFISLSGLDIAQVRTAAAEPGFLVAVLDYLAGDEPLLIAFATDLPCDPAQILRARHVLDPWEATMT